MSTPRRAGEVLRRIAVQLAAIGLSAVLLALANPVGGQWPALAFIAFAPWLAAVSGLRWHMALLSGLVFGLAYIMPLHWTTFAVASTSAGGSTWMAVAMFVCFALPFAVFAGINSVLPDRFQGGALVAPLLQSALLASLICVVWAPFPYTPAVALTAWPSALQLASLGGEAGLLWLMLWPNAQLAWLLRSARHWRAALPAIGVVLMGLAMAFTWGHLRLGQMDAAERNGQAPRLSALPLQLDLPKRSSPQLLLRNQSNGNRSALEMSSRAMARAPHCELVLWPELPLSSDRSAQVCDQAPMLARQLGVPLLLQCLREADPRWLIEAQWWWPDGSAGPTHAKSALIAGYEDPLWSLGTFGRGTPGTVFEFDATRRLLPTLCYELHSRAHLRRGVLDGAQFVLHMASFTPFERHPIDVWDQAMAQLRAVEFGVPIVRSANRGPSGWIDAGGRIRSRSEQRIGRHAECVEVWSAVSGPTLYTYLAPVGPWLPLMMALLLMGLATGWRRISGPRPSRVQER